MHDEDDDSYEQDSLSEYKPKQRNNTTVFDVVIKHLQKFVIGAAFVFVIVFAGGKVVLSDFTFKPIKIAIVAVMTLIAYFMICLHAPDKSAADRDEHAKKSALNTLIFIVLLGFEGVLYLVLSVFK